MKSTVLNQSQTTITILGSGTCVPSLQRSACSVLAEIDSQKLLFDCGTGTMRRLLETGTKIFDISFIFFSHFHPDHTGELVPFLFATKYPDENQRQFPLTIIAAKNFSRFYKGLKAVYSHWIELPSDLLNIFELDNQSYDRTRFDGFYIESLPVEHRPESIAYRVTDSRGKSFVYSGDTDYSENLVILSKNADLLICEAALPDAFKVEGHLTPSLAGEIAARANVGQLVLTHFYPQCEAVDIAKECRKTYKGRLTLAYDLMKIRL